jgi:YD repeat-containing protein
MWYDRGKVHREGNPAYRVWDKSGALIEQTWYRNNKKHRDKGPACRKWNVAGQLLEQIWFKNDRFHRDNGPAYRQWASNGYRMEKRWYQNDHELTQAEIKKLRDQRAISAMLSKSLPQPIFEEVGDEIHFE